MKKIALSLIYLYQKFFSRIIKMIIGVDHFCRYNPTCSDFAKISIAQYGLIKGGSMALIRILSCQPIQFQTTKVKLKNYLLKAGSR